MAMAYTPGLKRKAETMITKTRKLPIKGDVLVKKGDIVTWDTDVAVTNLPGKVNVLNMANILELETSKGIHEENRGSLGLMEYMVKREGDQCEKGDLIASRKTFFGLFKRECYAPISGQIEYVSDVTGQCLLREPPIPLTLNAYVPGVVTNILPEEGVEIRTPAALIQGIFGVGGETHGEIAMVSKSPDAPLTEADVSDEYAGKIIVGGSLVDNETLKKAASHGIKGIIVGGIRDADLSSFLGYNIGVAITGEEKIGLTLILTEGFGKMEMAEKTYQFFQSFEGKLACINGATQIRAGVIRPEIIIPLEESDLDHEETEELNLEGLSPGLPVRIIGPPYFGSIGHVSDLPVELQNIDTESSVRVLEVELDDGRKVIVPRANVEMIEE